MTEILDTTTDAAPSPRRPEAPINAPAAPPSRRPFRPSRLLDLLVLAALAFLLFWPGLGSLPLTDRDEAATVSATRSMVASGNWLAVPEGGVGRTGAHPLVHWAQGIALGVDGGAIDAGLIGVRMPSLAGAVLAVLFTYGIGLVLGGRVAGLAAAALCASTVLLGTAARLATADTLLLAAVTAAMFALASAWMDPAPRRTAWRTALFWTAIGVGLLVDGPMTLLVVGTTAAALAASDRSAARLMALDPLRGAPAALIVPVALAVWTALSGEGRSYVDAYGADLVARIAGMPGHRAPPGTHAIVSVGTFWPLSALVPVGLVFAGSRARPAGATRALAFVGAWILPTWLALEAVPAKLPNAALPLVPAVAGLVGLAFACGTAIAGRWVRAAVAFIPVGAVLLAFGLNAGFVVAEQRASLDGILLGLLAIVAAFSAAWLLHRDRPGAGLGATLVAAGAMTALAFALLLPAARSLWPSERMADAVAAVKTCDMPEIIVTGHDEPSLRLMLPGVRVLPVEAAAEAFAAAGCAVAIVPTAADPSFQAAAGTGPPAAGIALRALTDFERRLFSVHARP